MRKTVSHNLHYAIEMAVGLISILGLLFLGEKGGAFFALYAITAFYKRPKPDEREIQLFHKASTATLASVFLTMFAVYYLLPSINWLLALAYTFIFFHGLWGLLMLRSG
jgi:uncharacterized membrane-anchored protein